MIALQEDEQFRAPLQLLRTLFLAIGQGCAKLPGLAAEWPRPVQPLVMFAAMRRASSRTNSRCANGCENGRFSALGTKRKTPMPNQIAILRDATGRLPCLSMDIAQFGAVKVSWHCWPVSSTTWVERSPISGCLQSSGASLTMGTTGTYCANICWCSG